MARKPSYATLEKKLQEANKMFEVATLRMKVAMEDAKRADIAQEQLRQEFNKTISEVRRNLSAETARADMWSGKHKELTEAVRDYREMLGERDMRIVELEATIVKLAVKL